MLLKILSNRFLIVLFLMILIFQVFIYLMNFFDQSIVAIHQEYIYFFYLSALYVNLWVLWVFLENYKKISIFDSLAVLLFWVATNMIAFGMVLWFYSEESWKGLHTNGFYIILWWIFVLLLQEITYLYE